VIKTYLLGNYHHPSTVNLKAPGPNFSGGSTSILNDRVIKYATKEMAWFFNEYGTLLCKGALRSEDQPKGPLDVAYECISPVSKFEATYTSQKIRLRNLGRDTARSFAVTGLKKLSFNQAGTYILAEFLNEPPRIFSTAKFLETSSLPANDLKGFPVYVYETITVPDAEAQTAVFDSLQAKVPHLPKAAVKLKKFIDIPDYNKKVGEETAGLKNDINSSYTNSGYIVNLANNRPISKIQSLIKLSGDIKLSPDKTIMLLNTGKIVSLYSIPYARILINIRGGYQQNLFSPDSKWLVQYSPGKRLSLVNLLSGQVDTIPFKFKAGLYRPIHFSADSKQLMIPTVKGSCAIVDVAAHQVLQTTDGLGYFGSPDGQIYGVVDFKAHNARLYKTSDSSKPLCTIDLNIKTKRKEQATYDYQIAFSSGSPVIAIWNEARAILLKDPAHPTDTTICEFREDLAASQLTLSPNGAYLAVQTIQKASVIFNCSNKTCFTLSPATGFLSVFNSGLGATLRTMSSGNMDNITGVKEIAVFSSSGDSVMACRGDSVFIYRCSDSAKLTAYKSSGDVKYYSLVNDLAVAYYYGQLEFYRLSDRQEWFSMIPFTNGETVFLLPDGTYFGNKSATRHLGYMSDARSLSYNQFDYNNNRPDIVLRALGNTNQHYLAIYDSSLAIRRRREGMRNTTTIDFDKAPEISIANENDIKGEMTDNNLSIALKIRGVGHQPDRLAIFINGNPLASDSGIRLSHKSLAIDTTVKLTLTEGSNLIEVSVFDVKGLESYRVPLYIQYSPSREKHVPKTLYFAGIGAQIYRDAGSNLHYARKDVIDILNLLRLYYHTRIVVDTLFNSDVTVENVRNMRAKLTEAKPDDIVFVYYSGHGEVKGRAEASFGTYDMDFNNPGERGLSIRDFNYLTESIPARNKVIFLDACHSGEINQYGGGLSKALNKQKIEILNPGEMEPFDVVLDLFTDLYQGNGTDIVVAARGQEAAKECDSIGHGVFTYAVMNGLTNLTADEDADSVLTIGELQNYVTKNVSLFADICQPNLIQRASTRKENEYNDWPIAARGNARLHKKTAVIEVDDAKPIFEQGKDLRNILRGKSFKDIVTNSDMRQAVIGGVIKIIRSGREAVGSPNPKILSDYANSPHPDAKPLIEDLTFLSTYEQIDKRVIFSISCPGYIPCIFADVNGNGKIDECIDRVYTVDSSFQGIFTRSVMMTEPVIPWLVTRPGCAKLNWDAGALAIEDQYYFVMPVKELSTVKGQAKVVVRFYPDDKTEVIHYPLQGGNQLFSSVIELKFR